MKKNKTDRRTFLKQLGLAAAGTFLVPQLLKASGQTASGQNGRVLVVVYLAGGNDGLNTVVPFRNDIYYKSRPKLHIPKNEVLKLNDDLGLNPEMGGARELYDKGELAILNNVGYPEPDRSHFWSEDVWQTGRKNSHVQTGWIGRYLDETCSGSGCAHQALEVNDRLSLVMKGENQNGLAIRDADKIFRITRDPFLQQIAANPPQAGHSHHAPASYLHKTLVETMESTEYLYEKSRIFESTVDYGKGELAKRMRSIAELISAGASTSIYFVSLGGFDTHNNQRNRQDKLLEQWSRSIERLAFDLKKNNRWKDTLVLTFSEFGRRVEENGSYGTDHGTANNLFLAGGALKNAGFLNEAPNLSDLEMGDLKYSVDFRRVYATILRKWLNVDPVPILGNSYQLLNFV